MRCGASSDKFADVLSERIDLSAPTYNRGEDTRTQITRRIDGKALRNVSAIIGRYEVVNSPVCMPKQTPRPNKVRKSTRGKSPAGGGPFLLSVAARIMSINRKVPRNSEKKAPAFVR